MARAADNLTVEERIERIATIFNTFRNPDKETVLTPWRVVNMHLGNCLGGYCFYDERYERMLELPRLIDNGKVTRNVFSPDSRVLEINSKSGLYPLFVAYNIYRRRMEEAREKYGDINRAFAQSLWDTTVEQNIFVICKTPMARSITRRTLVGFRQTRVNAQYYKDLIDVIKNNPATFVNEVRDGRRFWKANDKDHMTFNAIVGNPPYQIMDGGAGASAMPIYNRFVEISKLIKPYYISLIIPARWYAGGKGLDGFRDMMLNDIHISKIIDFVNSKECFPTASIGGGILFYLWNNLHNGLCEFTSIHNGEHNTAMRSLNEYEIFIRYNQAIDIASKVRSLSDTYMTSIISSRNPFGLSSDTRGMKNGDYKLIASEGVSYLEKNNFIDNCGWANKYKVLISKVTAEHAGEPDRNGMFRVISRMEILQPLDLCTDSYLVIGGSQNKDKVFATYKYLRCKFSRFMLMLSVSSINLSKEKFQFVPLQDFTPQSDIDWSKSISEIDAQLYEKYGLEKDEVEFIERMIKPME